MKRAIGPILALTTAAIGIACGGDDAPTPQPQRVSGQVTVDGQPRTFTLNLPPAHAAGRTVPLVIALHGGGGNGAQFEATSHLTEKADAAGFAVVYPDGSSASQGLNTWNGGGCCGYAVNQNIDDVAFMRTLIAQLTGTYRIDAKRIYATGHSNGGILSYRLACDLSDRIAAIAPNAAASMVVTPCNPTRPVPVLHMHSKLDTNVPIEGGAGTGPSQVPYPPLADSLDAWVRLDACATPPTVRIDPPGVTRTTWSPCSGAAAVVLVLTDDGGHGWPGGDPGRTGSDQPSRRVSANELLWAFFERYSLP